MTQYPTNPQGAPAPQGWNQYDPSMGGEYPGGMYDVPARTSKLAITTFVMGLLSCACLPGLLGVILGLIAIPRISASGGRLKGYPWAGIGLALSLLGVAGWVWLGKGVAHFISLPPLMSAQFIQAAQSGDTTAALGLLDSAGGADDARVLAFSAEFQQRYGTFFDARHDATAYQTQQQPIQAQDNAIGTQDIMFPVLLNCSGGKVSAVVVLRAQPMSPMTPRILAMTFEPGSSAEWSFPDKVVFPASGTFSPQPPGTPGGTGNGPVITYPEPEKKQEGGGGG